MAVFIIYLVWRASGQKLLSFGMKKIKLIVTTSMNVLWIRNCSTYSEPMTLHALGWPAGSRQTPLHGCYYHVQADVMAAILKIREIQLRQSMCIYLKNNPAKFHPSEP